MAKLAVILFLFALCAVAMSARIAREEPTQKPLDQLQGQFQNLIGQLKDIFQNPEIQKSLGSFAEKLQVDAKQFGDKVQELVSATPKP